MGRYAHALQHHLRNKRGYVMYEYEENIIDKLVSALEAVRDSGVFDWEGGVAYEAEAKQVREALALVYGSSK